MREGLGQSTSDRLLGLGRRPVVDWERYLKIRQEADPNPLNDINRITWADFVARASWGAI